MNESADQPGALAQNEPRHHTGQQSTRDVLRHEKVRVTNAVVALESGHAARGQPTHVTNFGGWDVLAAPSVQDAAQAEVDVLEVGKEALVEHADVVEERAAIEGGSSARRHDRRGFVPAAVVGAAVPTLMRNTGAVDVVTGRVEMSAALVQDFGGEIADCAGRLGHPTHENSKPVRLDLDVVVEQCDKRPSAGADAGVRAAGKAGVAPKCDDVD